MKLIKVETNLTEDYLRFAGSFQIERDFLQVSLDSLTLVNTLFVMLRPPDYGIHSVGLITCSYIKID